MRYDPDIALAFATQDTSKDMDIWPLYDAVRCRTLLIRGQHSDLCLAATAHEMALRGPKARVVDVPGVGHAPTLIHDDQIALVREYLLGSQQAVGSRG
jgi:pimeloyl-ACP methyl ester carboxylesterase